MNITNIPEVLKDFDVDWRDYEPPGGEQWHSFFHETHKSSINEVIAEYDRLRARFSNAIARANTLGKHFKEIRKFLGGYGSIIGLDIAVMNDVNRSAHCSGTAVFSRTPKASTLAWINGADDALADLTDWTLGANELKKELAVIDEDVKFLHALNDFFSKDQDLDMILYSLRKIPVKYRTKVFRTGYKVYREVLECMNVIETSKSGIKDEILGRFSVAYLELKKAYKTLPIAMKEMKKGSDAEGSAFWERKDIEDAAFMRRNNIDESKICQFASKFLDELAANGGEK